MGIFSVFPLLTIPVVVYNLMAFVFNKGPDLVAGEAATTTPALASTLAAPIVSVPMVSGASWTMDGGDILILVSLLSCSWKS